jgi:hypothetical protein
MLDPAGLPVGPPQGGLGGHGMDRLGHAVGERGLDAPTP